MRINNLELATGDVFDVDGVADSQALGLPLIEDSSLIVLDLLLIDSQISLGDRLVLDGHEHLLHIEVALHCRVHVNIRVR